MSSINIDSNLFHRKTKKNKRKTLTGGPDTPGGPDSRSSTPVNEKETKPKITPVVTNTQLVQESASDVVKKKKGRMDPTIGMVYKTLMAFFFISLIFLFIFVIFIPSTAKFLDEDEL